MRSHRVKRMVPVALLFAIGAVLTLGVSTAQAAAGMIRGAGALSNHGGANVGFVALSAAIAVFVLAFAIYPAVANRGQVAPALPTGEPAQLTGVDDKAASEQERKAA